MDRLLHRMVSLKPDMNWKLQEHRHHCPQRSEFFITVEWEGANEERSSSLQAIWPDWQDLCLEAFKPTKTIRAVKHGGGSPVLGGCFAASRAGTLHKVNGIMKEEDFLQILQHHLKSAGWLKHGHKHENDHNFVWITELTLSFWNGLPKAGIWKFVD